MATWPSNLPVTLDNYSETPPDRIIRSSMEVGPQKMRRRSSAQVRKVSLSLMLTDAQLVTLNTFYDTNDALAFDFIDLRTNTAVRARFAGVPKYNKDDYLWSVSVELEYLP